MTNHFSFQNFFEKGGLGYKVNYVSSFQFFTQIALKCIHAVAKTSARWNKNREDHKKSVRTII